MGQKALGIIAFKVKLDHLYMDALFHVIDVKTFYSALFRWLWLYNSKDISFTLHQCLKYADKHGNRRISWGDASPFHEEDVNYADANFIN